MWDSDWRPEGFGVVWEKDLFFAQGIGTWIESDSKKGEAQITYFLNDIDLASGNPRDFDHLMLDLKFKYN
jgi:hypothetical protein